MVGSRRCEDVGGEVEDLDQDESRVEVLRLWSGKFGMDLFDDDSFNSTYSWSAFRQYQNVIWLALIHLQMATFYLLLSWIKIVRSDNSIEMRYRRNF